MESRLREARKAKKITQTGMSRRTGISLRGYLYIESGEKNPNLLAALQIARVLRCKVEDLWSLEPDEFTRVPPRPTPLERRRIHVQNAALRALRRTRPASESPAEERP